MVTLSRRSASIAEPKNVRRVCRAMNKRSENRLVLYIRERRAFILGQKRRRVVSEPIIHNRFANTPVPRALVITMITAIRLNASRVRRRAPTANTVDVRCR